MVMFPSTKQGRFLKFHSDALDPNTLLVRRLTGTEAISRPYRFELELLAEKKDLDTVAVLSAPASIGIKQSVQLSATMKRGIRTLKIHGVLAQFEQFDLEGSEGRSFAVYRAIVVPHLWKLSLNIQNRIFLEKTVPQIIEEILKGNGFTKDMYELRCASRTYAVREYVVQFAESDLDFVSRLCEHEGISYLWEQDDNVDKVVFSDSTDDFRPILGGDTIPYRPKGSGGKGFDWVDAEAVRTFALRHKAIPAAVLLQDYNYRTPSTPLKAEAPVVPHGHGTYFEYGAHYKDTTEGGWLAQVRADELRCRERIFSGTSDGRAFRSGATFRLSDHYREDFNRAYLLTHVKHDAEQQLDIGTAKVSGGFYGVEFQAIPADVVFRPERITPKPKIIGSVNARVDGSGDGKYAEIDGDGRYKVKIPFDMSDRGKGGASRFLRMAQPYAGGGMGMHFPLHPGTEVILTHVNGDPDRPMIAAAVPNPESESPVKGGNATQCVIQSGGGNKIAIEDADGGQQIKLSSPTQNTYISIGAPNSPGNLSLGSAGNMLAQLGGDNIFKAAGDDLAEVGGNQNSTIFGNHRKLIAGNFNSVVGGKYLDEVTQERFIVTVKSVVDKTMQNRAHLTQQVHAISCKQLVIKTDLECVMRIATDLIVSASKGVGIEGAKEIILLSGDSNASWKPEEWGLKAKKFGMEATAETAVIKSKGNLTLNALEAVAELKAKTTTVEGTEALNLTATGKTITVRSKTFDFEGEQMDLKSKVTATKEFKIEGQEAKLKVKGTNFVVE